MLTFVCWKWTGPDPARTFPPASVNVLHAMLTRHYHAPFRLVCLTDDPAGIDAAIDVRPLPVTKADALRSVHDRSGKLWPACFRRLWLFSEEACVLGDRLVNIDLDVVILDDITELLQSKTASFVGWCSNNPDAWLKIAGGIWMLDAGQHTNVWTDFEPATSPTVAYNAGYHGSDQAWLSHKLYPPKERWSAVDGLLKLGWLAHTGRPPPHGARIIFTNGFNPPWRHEVQLGSRWILDHWKL